MRNPLLIFSYYEDIWLDLDMLLVKHADILTICTPRLERPLDLSNSKVWVTFKNVKRVNVWHKIIQALRFYLMFPYFLLRYKIFLFVAPPYFHFLAMPILSLFKKEVYTIAGDPYSEIAQESLWQASKSRIIIRNVLYPFYILTEYIGIHWNKKVFAVTKYLYTKYSPWVSIELGRNGGPVDEISAMPIKHATPEEYLFYVGGIVKWRGVDLLVNAFKLIKEKYKKPLKLVIVGGSKEEFQNFPEVKELGLYAQDIIFTGWLPHDKALSFLKGAKIAVMPHRNTLMSRAISSAKVFEYISAEIPQVCTNSGDHAELVQDLDVGIVVNDDSESIAKGIIEVLTNEKLYQKFKNNCKDKKYQIDYKVMRAPIQKTINEAVLKYT